ncbi:hypothetical protein [Photobacterium nomapromontoriensis]|uniref:hypothetical protein n=1 Tax=Photobacterium nomapromontoriensis TaxID=2910237 RepID=UPI003D13BAF2
MKKTGYWSGVSLLAILLMGCSSADWNKYQLFPDEYTYNPPYDSIYHYGYNQGCETALNAKGLANTQSVKDATLDRSDTDYDAGWNAGNKACIGGQQVLMPSSRIMPGSSVHDQVTY